MSRSPEAIERRNESRRARLRKHREKIGLRGKLLAALAVSQQRESKTGIKGCTATIDELMQTWTTACDICERECLSPCMDHDHKTGRFRGWICPACNLGLGKFADDPRLLKRAIDYLEVRDA